jgi:hypothetical protein
MPGDRSPVVSRSRSNDSVSRGFVGGSSIVPAMPGDRSPIDGGSRSKDSVLARDSLPFTADETGKDLLGLGEAKGSGSCGGAAKLGAGGGWGKAASCTTHNAIIVGRTNRPVLMFNFVRMQFCNKRVPFRQNDRDG